jgi:cytochrome c
MRDNCRAPSSHYEGGEEEVIMFRRSIIASILTAALLTACSKVPSDSASDTSTPAANAVDTLGGAKLADFTGDAASGEATFAQCKSCHAIEAGVNRTGPSLHAVVGRKAAHIDGFNYSSAMRASGIVWSEPKLFEYLESPRRVVPGTTMSYFGITDPQKRADVIAYLKANGS